jgi:NAD(P)-dependent dehydrogenase (short-subunit alcohol dehydrogenase family)
MASRGEQELAEKVALITGGSRGIGRAIACAYTRAGAKVFICGRDEKNLRATVDEVRLGGGEIDGLAGDVGSLNDVQRIVSAAARRYGTIHVLVNNASILGPRDTIANYPPPAWQEVLRINLTGIFLITQAVLPIMSGRGSGSIINVTSGVGRRGKARWGAYAISKAGVESLTQVLADEVSRAGIRVNSVNPAATRTRMRAQAYPSEDPLTLPTPEEILPLFLYLASDASAGVSGQSLEARDWLKSRD